MLRISNVKTPPSENPSDLQAALLEKLGLQESDLLDYQVHRQSIDARKRGRLCFVYTLDVMVKDEEAYMAQCRDKDIVPAVAVNYREPEPGTDRLSDPPVIIGTGPAGLFAGLLLALLGYRPLVLERGSAVPERTLKVQRFWESGTLDPECNVQFGEGGAGTFSDGKLTTLIRDTRCRRVMEELVSLGAPPEIMYSYRPHVGTDILKKVVTRLRQKIEHLGGTVKFSSRLSDLVIENNRVTKLIVNSAEVISAQVMILAPGHSARDTFHMVHRRGIPLAQKPFSMGVRIEHPQDLINGSRYHHAAPHPALGPADYKLVYHHPSGRSLYTFCMCPGGQVIAAASETGALVTNGMSLYARSGVNANSALLVGVHPEDFPGTHPLAGIEFQRRWEQAAYILGKGNYSAPAQLAGDFLKGRSSTGLGAVTPSYAPGITLTNLQDCLPLYIIETIRSGIPEFNRKLKDFSLSDAVLTGVETRSSSPVRIVRDENLESTVAGLYPCGEGAGYAGGIISAAVDGMKAAEAVIKRYAPL